MSDLDDVSKRAQELIAEHLDPSVWTFGFDNAKARAGQCDYRARRITVSRHLCALYSDRDVEQILLHEIAHALAGSDAGHGPRWREVAVRIGFTGGRVHPGSAAHSLAPWVGECPRGHTHYRFRRPSRTLSCGRCAGSFDRRNLIRWKRRDVRAGQSSTTSTSFQNAT